MPIEFSPNQRVVASSKKRVKGFSRTDAHRHAEEYLSKISQEVNQVAPNRKISPACEMAFKFLGHFTKGLEGMFKVFNLRP